MIAVVRVDDDGSVYASVDTDHDSLDDLGGMLLDQMLDQASRAALATWNELHTEAPDDGE